jgi:hypothetical protein
VVLMPEPPPVTTTMRRANGFGLGAEPACRATSTRGRKCRAREFVGAEPFGIGHDLDRGLSEVGRLVHLRRFAEPEQAEARHQYDTRQRISSVLLGICRTLAREIGVIVGDAGRERLFAAVLNSRACPLPRW